MQLQVPPSSQQLNQQQTLILNKESNYINYKKWVADNGVLVDQRIIYPAYFGTKGQGMIGVAAKTDLPSQQAIIAVPYSLIICIEKIRLDPQIDFIVSENSHFFKLNESNQSPFHLMLLYISRQLMKGQKSFYYPYFSICSPVSLTNWSHWDLLALQNQQVAKLIKRQLEKVQLYSAVFTAIFRKYLNFFPNLSNNQYQQIVDKAYAIICTRSFGWPLPSMYLIPMADSLNHNIEYVDHMLIDTQNEKKQNEVEGYKKRSNKLNLSLLNIENRRQQTKMIQIRSNKQKLKSIFERVKQNRLSDLKQQLQEVDESCSEDNQSDEQEVQKMKNRIRKFKLNENQNFPGANKQNNREYLIKYWQMYIDPKFLSQNQCQSNEDDKSNEQSSKPDSQQCYDWLTNHGNNSTTYFVMTTMKQMHKNQQLHNFYGRRSNKYLLSGYNFVMLNNKYDSFPLRINIPNWLKDQQAFYSVLPVSKIISSNVSKNQPNIVYSRQIRIKRQRVSIQLINHCRALVIGWQNGEQTEANKRITVINSKQEQRQVLKLAKQLIKYVQSQYMTTLEQDKQVIKKDLKFQVYQAIQLKILYKQILDSQLQLLNQCERYMESSSKQIKSQSQLDSIIKIKEYIYSLQSCSF